MLEELLPEDVWREPQPVLSVQGGVDWDPGIHDRCVSVCVSLSARLRFIQLFNQSNLSRRRRSGFVWDRSINPDLSEALIRLAPIPPITPHHHRLIQALHAVSLDLASVGGGPLASSAVGLTANSVPFRFLSLDKAVVFPPKKPPSPLKAPDGRPLDGYAIKGLLKGSWMHKHVAQLPSAAILLAPLDMAWSIPEWSRREQQLLQDLERLRLQLGPRDVRVFTLLVRHHAHTAAPSAQEEREVEERLMTLRRRLPAQYDNRLLYVLGDPTDLHPASLAMRRLYKHVRDASSGYYFLAAKRVKRLETALSRHTQAPLIVRYRLKMAVWTEFLGDADKAVKYYRKAFEALLDMNATLQSAATAAAAAAGGGGGWAFAPGGGGGGGGGGGAPVPLGLGLSGSGCVAACLSGWLLEALMGEIMMSTCIHSSTKPHNNTAPTGPSPPAPRGRPGRTSSALRTAWADGSHR
jgi:hypothetical protein